MLKKIITLTLIAVIILSSSFSYAANTTVTDTTATTAQTQSTWIDLLSKLKLMGVVNDSDLNTTGNMTREVFSKIIVNATGNSELAQSLSGSTTFSDVAKTSALCGYINAAVNKGYLTAYSDGKFKPKNPLNFAQLCTAMIKALGYVSDDIIGTWPNGYIEKAKSLGITTGFSLKSTDSVLTSATITMISRMLNTNIKKANAQDADVMLKDSAGLLNDQKNWVYGKPEVAFSFDPNSKKLGSITFNPSIPILRNTTDNNVAPATSVVGESITLYDIKDKDVVYEVYNKLNVLMYYLVVDNKTSGEITSILPNKYSPSSIKINDVSYDLGDYVKIDKFNSSNGSFNVKDDVSVLLGYDGKVLDAYYTMDANNENYAFVVNCATMVSKETANYGEQYYTVDLLQVDGNTKTYKVKDSAYSYKWRLVEFKKVSEDEDTVSLVNLSYMSGGDVSINKYEGKVGQSYKSDNIKIFNYTDSKVSLLDWNSIPNGTLISGKVKFIANTGDFGDVNVMLINDALDEQYQNMAVQKIEVPKATKDSYKYTLVSGSGQYTYTSRTEISGAVVGSILRMKVDNSQIAFDKYVNADGTGGYVQAIDNKRIKLNNYIYMFDADVKIYFIDNSGNLAVKTIDDIKVGANGGYGSIKLYCDRPLSEGGKIQAIVFGNR
ncbi:MAG: S-layer homology domain-containing protein [Ruminiclostridium sp.]